MAQIPQNDGILTSMFVANSQRSSGLKGNKGKGKIIEIVSVYAHFNVLHFDFFPDT